MLVSQFEGIRMLEEETFNEFYTKISDLRNSMINLGKKISYAKIIKKILRSLPEWFRIKVTTIEKSKDFDTMKIEELVGSLQTYEFSLPPFRKTKSIAFKVAKEKSNNSSDGKFRNKNVKSSENPKGDFKGTSQEKFESDKKDPRDPRCYECSRYGHIHADCGNLKQSKGKALNGTLSDDSDSHIIDETSGKDSNYLAFTASYDSPHESNNYYSENIESEDEQNEL